MASCGSPSTFAPRRLAEGAWLPASGDGRIVNPADVAQLVERNLAKVEVAGSKPVVRSGE